MTGAIPRVFGEGTVGHAYATGSNKYGLPHNERLAVRSEYFQDELTVYPDGTAELTSEPTAGPLPKGTVIYNEEQTKQILKNHGQKGISLASGTKHIDYSYLKDFSPTMYEWFSKQAYKEFEPDMTCIKNSIQDMNKKFETSTQNIQNVSTTGDTHYEINITISCPNVTNTSGAEEIVRILESKFQGLSLNAYQHSHLR